MAHNLESVIVPNTQRLQINIMKNIVWKMYWKKQIK